MKLNHILVITTDLKMMKDFWTQVIGLQPGDRPPFPFKGLWLYSEGTPFVHVAEQKDASFGHGSIAHLAFEGADYGGLLSRLKQSNHAYTEKDVSLSGDRQVFIAGPDGLTVEMMFPLSEIQKRGETKEHKQE
ncbi:MAG: lactoylglutathione lyase [Thiothrix sp.]|nr:MAG: lactoylglutathione lyase [Thiothrix sp.]